MKQKYQLKHETKYQQTNEQTKDKPEKGTQLDWITGEATSTASETEAVDNSFKCSAPSSYKISINPNKSLIQAIY